MGTMRNKTKPLATCLAGLKRVDETSKKDGKTYTKWKGSFKDFDGTGYSLTLSNSSDQALKDKGVSYWVEVAKFAPDNHQSHQGSTNNMR